MSHYFKHHIFSNVPDINRNWENIYFTNSAIILLNFKLKAVPECKMWRKFKWNSDKCQSLQQRLNNYKNTIELKHRCGITYHSYKTHQCNPPMPMLYTQQHAVLTRCVRRNKMQWLQQRIISYVKFDLVVFL